jgi:RNA polymerase sigma-70 factor (ECF subfamily)
MKGRCAGVVRVLCGRCGWPPPRRGSTLAGMTGDTTAHATRDFSRFGALDVGQRRRRATALPPGESFDAVVLPHLAVAYRLARWLMRNEHDAEDAVQEASLRAFRYFRTFDGGDGRAWFLRIVRNICSGRRGRRFDGLTDPFDEEQHRGDWPTSDPETLLLQTCDATLIARALATLPGRFHQLLVLRELEGLSYREMADVMRIPMGTVMSSLSRARRALRCALDSELKLPAIAAGTHASRTGDRALSV